MTLPVELVPLRCLRCDTPVPAEINQVVWACDRCGQGLLLDEKEGLLTLEIHYSTGIDPDGKGKPYWITRGQVSLTRQAHREWSDIDQRVAQSFWEDPRVFVIPAYTLPMEELLERSMKTYPKLPGYSEGPPVPFEPVTLSPSDLPSLVEFIVLADEAGREDNLKSIDISVELDTPHLWVLP